jgi:hypothetical protein
MFQFALRHKLTVGCNPVGHIDQAGKTCVGAIVSMDFPPQDPWLVGDTFLKNVYTIFNQTHPPQVGFATLI